MKAPMSLRGTTAPAASSGPSLMAVRAPLTSVETTGSPEASASATDTA